MQSTVTEALIKLYLTYSDDLYDYAFYRIQNSQTAEDLVQSVFTLACKKIERIPSECHRAWLYTVMRNQIRTHFRQMKAHREVTIEDEKILNMAAYEMDYPNIDELEFPPGLNAKFCEILRLRAVEQLDYDEIARRLGISEASARQRFSRAAKAYKKLKGREKNFCRAVTK